MTIKRSKVGARMSQCVVHGDTVYLAGQVADDPNTDVAGQTKQILAKIDGLLAEAGSDKSKLLSATVWLSDIRAFDGCAPPPEQHPGIRGHVHDGGDDGAVGGVAHDPTLGRQRMVQVNKNYLRFRFRSQSKCAGGLHDFSPGPRPSFASHFLCARSKQ